MKPENRKPKTETKGAQHTPGPWTHKTLFPAMGGMVFEVNSNDGNVMKIRGGCIPIKQDADLIAAAPELLEMLRQLVEELVQWDYVAQTNSDGEYGDNTALGQARAAIAKATGKE